MCPGRNVHVGVSAERATLPREGGPTAFVYFDGLLLLDLPDLLGLPELNALIEIEWSLIDDETMYIKT